MDGTRYCLRLGLLALAAVSVAGQHLELRGEIKPAQRRALVVIDGATSPFTATTFSDSQGRFRFRKLAPGPYTVSVFVPGRGEVRQTVEVSPSLADSKGRTAVTVQFSPSSSSSSRALERRGTVSVRELSIPNRARREYNEALKKLGRRDVAGAIRHLERAVELAPQFVSAWNNLGTIAYQSGRYEDAEKYFREALKHEPGAFAPVVNLGGVLLNLAKYEEALKYNRYAVQDQPQDALANSQLGLNYFFLDDQDRALKYLNFAKRLDPSHFSHPQLVVAEIYLQRGDRQAASKELKDFLLRHPDAPNAAEIREQIKRLTQTE
jgi:Tfp pilus assembly protein PilF